MTKPSTAGFDALPLDQAYVPELVLKTPNEVTLKTLRHQSTQGDAAVAEEAELKFTNVEIYVLNVRSTPWLQIVSVKSHQASDLLDEYEARAKANTVFHKQGSMAHFQLLFEQGSMDLIAESYEYRTTRVSTGRVRS